MRVSRASQHGVALIVALLLLVVLALMGISAMRTSMLNARISTSAQLAKMTFHAAESSLSATYTEMLDPDSVVLLTLLDGSPVQRCQKSSQANSPGACAQQDRFDSRGLLQAQSRTIQSGVAPDFSLLEGAQLSGQQLLVHHRVETTSEGAAPEQNVQAYHVQEYNLKAMTDPATLIAQSQNN